MCRRVGFRRGRKGGEAAAKHAGHEHCDLHHLTYCDLHRGWGPATKGRGLGCHTHSCVVAAAPRQMQGGRAPAAVPPPPCGQNGG